MYDAASGQQEFVRTAKIKRKDAEYAVIEFKSPRSGTSLSLVLAQINGEEQIPEGVDYIVCWTDPTGQDLEEGYHVLERSEDPWGENAEMYPNLPDKQQFPMFRIFNRAPDHINNLKKNKSYAIVISLERIFDDKIDEIETDLSETESTDAMEPAEETLTDDSSK